MRLQKFMAQAGVASRRKSEEMILENRLKVNGVMVNQLGVKVDPENDIITLDGQKIQPVEDTIYYLFHKPKYVITSVKDNFERKTVMDFIDTKTRIFPVGRLDFDSTGLLLLTNDGALTYKLTHPKFEISKTYEVTVTPLLEKDAIEALEGGISIEDDFTTNPAKVSHIRNNAPESIFEIQIFEGRNRQVRKMCEALGLTVHALKRIAMGPLKLGSLKPGAYRELTPAEISRLQEIN